jgi:hypothetical protein
MGTTMKKALTLALLTATLGLSTGLHGASSYGVNVADRSGERSPNDKRGGGEKSVKAKITKSKPTKETSVPAPSPLLLMGVAAGVVWGLRKLWPNRRVE